MTVTGELRSREVTVIGMVLFDFDGRDRVEVEGGVGAKNGFEADLGNIEKCLQVINACQVELSQFAFFGR